MKAQPQTAAERYCRALLYLYIIYLAAIPLGLHALLIVRGHGTLSIAVGWLPALIYIGTIYQFVAVESHPIKATFSVLLVPLQIVIATIVFDAGLEGFALVEAFAEIGGCLLAMTLLMFIHRPSGLFGAFVGATLAGLVLIPVGRMLQQHYSGEEALWMFAGSILVALMTALMNWHKILKPMATGKASAYTGEGREKVRREFLNYDPATSNGAPPIGIQDPQKWMPRFLAPFMCLWFFGGILLNYLT